MLGLKTQEGSKFESFFKLIQEAAAKQGSVFFAFAGEGNDIVLDDLEGEDMTGWLIPQDKVQSFKPEWERSSWPDDLERWDDYFLWAEWEVVNGEIRIHFNNYS